MNRPIDKSTSAGASVGENEEIKRHAITRRALLRAGWAIPVILVIAPPESIAQLGTEPEEPGPPGGTTFFSSRGRRGEEGDGGGVGVIGGGGSPAGGLGGQSGPGGYNGEEELFDLE